MVLGYVLVCSNGGATLTWVCVVKVCSSGYNNNVKLYILGIFILGMCK